MTYSRRGRIGWERKRLGRIGRFWNSLGTQLKQGITIKVENL